MSGKIYLLREGETLQPLSEQPYASEDLLQSLLARYPDLLAGDQIQTSDPRRWLLVSREVPIPDEDESAGRWSLDHLFLDQDAIPTLVEVKRSNDNRIRREVIGQMLDYAANAVVYWPVEMVRAKFEAASERDGEDPAELILALLQTEGNAGEIVEAFWAKVKTNLQAGRIRMVFVADEIPQELRRVIEFLNGQMDPAEVIGVEVRQFIGEGLKTLVPKVIGQTALAQQAKGTSQPSRRWDEATLLQELTTQHGPEAAKAAKDLVAWAARIFDRLWWGAGKQYGSVVPILQLGGYKWRFFYLSTDAQIYVYFQYLQDKPPFDAEEKRLQFLNKVNLIPGVRLPKEVITRYPTISLASLAKGEALERFQEAIEWAISEVRGHYSRNRSG